MHLLLLLKHLYLSVVQLDVIPKKHHALKEIGLHPQTLLTTLNSIVNTIEET